VSSAVQGELWQAVSTAWATRLIPGSAHTRGGRKGPRAVDADGGELKRNRPAAWRERASASLGELVLPHPISVGGGWQLGVEIVGDTAVTIATWALVAGVASGYAQGGVLSASTHILPQMVGSAGFALVFAALVTLLGYSEGMYQGGLPRSGMCAERTLAKVVALATVIAGVGGTRIVAWPWFAASVIANFAGLSARRRWGMRQKVRSCQQRPLNVLIAGAGPKGRELARYLAEHPEHGRAVRGFLDERGRRGFGILGGVNELARVARAEFADELIVIATEGESGDPGLADRAIAEARALKLDVRIVPQLAGLGAEGRWMESWGEIPVVALHREELPHGELVLKRGIDITLGVLGLVLVTPVMTVIGLLIAIDSGLPLFYRAERVGRKGQRFHCAKFRTMAQDADAARERLRAPSMSARGLASKSRAIRESRAWDGYCDGTAWMSFRNCGTC
jgi:Bacterial sugar transferase/CoA-binding domain